MREILVEIFSLSSSLIQHRSFFRREKIRFREEKRWGRTRREIFLPPLLLPSLSRLEGINYRVSLDDTWLLSFALLSPSFLLSLPWNRARGEKDARDFSYSLLSRPLLLPCPLIKGHLRVMRGETLQDLSVRKRESVLIDGGFACLSPSYRTDSHTHIITISFVSWVYNSWKMEMEREERIDDAGLKRMWMVMQLHKANTQGWEERVWDDDDRPKLHNVIYVLFLLSNYKQREEGPTLHSHDFLSPSLVRIVCLFLLSLVCLTYIIYLCTSLPIIIISSTSTCSPC